VCILFTRSCTHLAFSLFHTQTELMMSQGVYGHQTLMRKPEKAKWSVVEDSVLQQAVTMHDGKNWKSIASYLEGKTEVQVRVCVEWKKFPSCSCLVSK